MGVLFQRRPKGTSISNTNPLENYGLANIGVNFNTTKVFDDPQPVYQFVKETIEARIPENSPMNDIYFTLPNQ